MYKFDRLISIAKDLKSTHQSGRAHHVGFLLKKSKIIKIAVNNYNKTNRVSAQYKLTKLTNNKNFVAGIHCENALLSKMKFVKDLSPYKMVVIRINNNNKLSNSCPCVNCLEMLLKRNIKSIYYSTDQETFNKLP
jgi:deoxycytidylate deaminase